MLATSRAGFELGGFELLLVNHCITVLIVRNIDGIFDEQQEHFTFSEYLFKIQGAYTVNCKSLSRMPTVLPLSLCWIRNLHRPPTPWVKPEDVQYQLQCLVQTR